LGGRGGLGGSQMSERSTWSASRTRTHWRQVPAGVQHLDLLQAACVGGTRVAVEGELEPRSWLHNSARRAQPRTHLSLSHSAVTTEGMGGWWCVMPLSLAACRRWGLLSFGDAGGRCARRCGAVSCVPGWLAGGGLARGSPTDLDFGRGVLTRGVQRTHGRTAARIDLRRGGKSPCCCCGPVCGSPAE
jgi:hypothetical protein